MLLQLSEDQIGVLIPAFLHVNQELKISAMGPSIARHLPHVRVGMPCAEAFNIVNFHTAQFFEGKTGIEAVRIVSLVGDVSLCGAAIFHENGCLLAVRFVLSEETFSGGSLDLSDFSHSDPVVLSSMLIALQRALLEESQATAIELAHERQRSTDLLARTSRVAGYMAHDFNNLLSIIQLNTDRLLRQFGHEEKIGKLANIIHETALRGSDVTQSLMALSQQRTGTLQPISVDDVIHENASIFRSLVGSSVKLTINLNAAKHKSVFSYNDLLNGIINLLVNARESMPKGGRIELSTSISSGLISKGNGSQIARSGEYIAIRVVDNGQGMSDALLSRAFEPLFSSKPNGTGLGLASVRNFVVEMGGDVWLESAVGKGTTVHLHLPVAGSSASLLSKNVDALSSLSSDAQGQHRILLVEDEPYALEALSEMLEGEGYAVTPCSSGEEAIIALGRETYDVLLSDIIMPGQNGTDVARQASAAQPSIKIILMSGYVPDSAALEPGWMFLHKPMDSAELLRVISA